jgi:ketosteroid isomerase-like protein
MFSWVALRLVGRTMASLRAGDYRPALRLYADDIVFRFPGDSSWAGEYNGKQEVEAWMQRFVDAGLQSFPDEAVVKGPPWRMTLCVRGHIYLRSPEGETVYENRYVIWGRMAWGRLVEEELYEDTLRTEALDQYQASRGSTAASPS